LPQPAYCQLPVSAADAAPRWNILFVFADDWATREGQKPAKKKGN
jgi:hypothetical protein